MNAKTQTVETVEPLTTEEAPTSKLAIFKQKAFFVGTAVGVATTGLVVAALARKSGRVEIVAEIEDSSNEDPTD